LPALSQIGIVREGLRLVVRRETNIQELWKMTFEAAQYFDIDHEWVKSTFGVEVTGQRTFGMPATQMRDKNTDLDFFL
jgi:hypothetical protein